MSRVIAALALTLLAFNAHASKPRAPTSFCVDDKCAPDPVEASRLKWHPGHYMLLDGNMTTPELRAQHFKQIDAIAAEPSVRGVKLVLYWGAVERSQGDYTAGFAIIDQYLANLAASNKYLILSVQDRLFGGHDPATLDKYFPAYVTKAYGTSVMRNGLTLRVWQQPTMDREIAMAKAIAARYDGHPNFEMYQAEETAIAVPLGTNGYSIEAYGVQLKRMISASRGAFKQTIVRLSANFFGSDTQMHDLIAYCNTFNVAVGGPDTIPTQQIQADRLFMGSAGTDYRGVLPWVSEVQSPSLCGTKGCFTAKQLYDNGMLRQASHFVWYRNTWSGGAEQKWDTGILPFIKSIKGATKSACPQTYAGGCAD